MENRKAAIEWFSMLKKKFVKTEYAGYLDMAISALEEKERNKVPCGECKHKRGGSGYYECSLHGWRVKQFDSCKDGERRNETK